MHVDYCCCWLGPSGSVMVRCSQQLAFSSKSSETSYKPTGRQEYTPCQNKTIENGLSFISSIFGTRCSFSRTKSETYSSQSYLALLDTPSGFVFSSFQQIHKPISTPCIDHMMNRYWCFRCCPWCKHCVKCGVATLSWLWESSLARWNFLPARNEFI